MPDLTQLLDAATPGPWRCGSREHLIDAADNSSVARSYPDEPGHADAALIVAAVNALPALLAVVDAAREIGAERDEVHCFACHYARPCAHDDLDRALTDLDEVTRA